MAPAVTLTQQPGAFIGADSADARNVRSLQGNTSSRNNAGLGMLQNLFSQSQQQVNSNNQQGQSGSQPQIRVALRLGFRPAPVSTTGLQTFGTRLNQLPGIRWIGPAEVSLEGRTAVLRGTVASEDDRRLVEALAKMEPDVLDVRNELVVDSSGTTEEELPPPAPRSSVGPR
jgi:hypothetical protein